MEKGGRVAGGGCGSPGTKSFKVDDERVIYSSTALITSTSVWGEIALSRYHDVVSLSERDDLCVK